MLRETRTISFNEALHRYTDEYNVVYTSVTQCIGQYELPFKREYWLKYKAEELKITVEELDKEWTRLKDESCVSGTATHEELEFAINKLYGNVNNKGTLKEATNYSKGYNQKIVNINELYNSSLRLDYADIYNYLVKLIENGWTLYTEKRVYLVEHKIAGTIDIYAERGTEFIIVDWKTNKKELYFKSGYYKKEWIGGVKVETNKWVDTEDRFKIPIGHLPFCKGNIYTLQLSFYAHIMEEWGFTCKGLVLCHIRKNVPIKFYNIIYKKEEIIKILNHRKNGN